MSRNGFWLAVVLALAGAGAGYLASGGLALLTLEARRGHIAPERIAEARNGETQEEMALRMSGQPPEETARAAARARVRMSLASTAFGAWCGLVVAFRLRVLSAHSRRVEYETHPGRCLSCARCFAWCPRERARRRPRQESLT